MGFDFRIPTTLKVITDKLSFKELPLLKLSATFPDGNAPTIIWNDQVATEEGSNMVSGAENIPKSI